MRTPVGTANLTRSKSQWLVEWNGERLGLVRTLNDATRLLEQFGAVAAYRRGSNRNDNPTMTVDVYPRRKHV